MILHLPAPPSPNTIWRAFRGRVIRSREYRAWLDTAGKEIMAQRVRPISGPVFISVVCGENRRRDLDGFLKGTLDCLVACGLIETDRNPIVRDIHLTWDNAVDGVRVTVYAMEQRPG